MVRLHPFLLLSLPGLAHAETFTILGDELEGGWSLAPWNDGITAPGTMEAVYEDPCGQTNGLSYKASLPSGRAFDLLCDLATCNNLILPESKGGRYSNIVFEMFVPPTPDSCGAPEIVGDSESFLGLGNLAAAFHSGPGEPNWIKALKNFDREDFTLSSSNGKYIFCTDVPDWEASVEGDGWGLLAFVNLPGSATEPVHATSDFYLDTVYLADQASAAELGCKQDLDDSIDTCIVCPPSRRHLLFASLPCCPDWGLPDRGTEYY